MEAQVNPDSPPAGWKVPADKAKEGPATIIQDPTMMDQDYSEMRRYQESMGLKPQPLGNRVAGKQPPPDKNREGPGTII